MNYAYILILVLLLLSACSNNTQEEPQETQDLNSTECANLGGRIVNSLSETCNEEETQIADVTGMKCPCVCCVLN